MRTGPSITDWIQAGSSVVSLIVAIAVGGFAWIQLKRQKKESEAKELTALVRLSTTGLLLSRRIHVWLREERIEPHRVRERTRGLADRR